MHKQRIWYNRNHTILLALHPFIPDNDDHAKMSTKNFGTYHPIALQHISRIIQFSFYFLSRLLFNCINASFFDHKQRYYRFYIQQNRKNYH